MKVTIQQRRTVGELLAQAQQKYGPIEELRRYVTRHPRDVMAKLALHDLNEYHGEDPDKVIHESREIIIPDTALDKLTVQRLQLLLTVKGLVDAGPSVRALARAVHRDIKNVSEDIRILNELGLLEVEVAGKGKANRVRLAGDQIDLHLVEPQPG